MAEPPGGVNPLASSSTVQGGRVWCSEGTLQGLVEGKLKEKPLYLTNICGVSGIVAKNLEMLSNSNVLSGTPESGKHARSPQYIQRPSGVASI